MDIALGILIAAGTGVVLALIVAGIAGGVGWARASRDIRRIKKAAYKKHGINTR